MAFKKEAIGGFFAL